ncbi:uncharacterized protein LOC131940946 [Physella acuta]|uniref:uncharacterized protein LOC131940946 n=1 Tax=Physella acuta TaxID=109671 RepID=UPI0027DE84AF|nr:uncharacterized protein LOC131940946 [Physella acuta]
MAFQSLRRRIVGSSVDQQSDNTISLTSVLDLVDPAIRAQGEQLFDQFVMSQVKSYEVIGPCVQSILAPRTPTPVDRTQINDASNRLCELATRFAETEERKLVKETAVMLSSNMTGQDLATILTTMIGRTNHLEEGIVVLFYFCFDIILHRMTAKWGNALEVVNLCRSSLVQILGPRVQASGGWGKVFTSGTRGGAMLGLFATGMFVLSRIGPGILLIL